MEQLTLKEIYELAEQLLAMGEDIGNYPVYLSDDHELNGIHCAWFTSIVDTNNRLPDIQCLVQKINQEPVNVKLQHRAILLS